MKRNTLVLMLVVVALAGCGSGGGGGSAAPVAITEASNKAAYDKAVLPFNDIYSRWKSAETLAGASSRIALSGPVMNLQNIKREADALVVSKCMLTPKANLTAGMDSIINGYIAFMGQNSYSTLMNTGNTYLTQYEKDLLNQKLCDFSIM
ncbi:MAG: hypothetical protein HYV06_07460 [Deltaproteobacteria bacterium]|nr:hypothetical protein [Deltaproteobacteria bacterium]